MGFIWDWLIFYEGKLVDVVTECVGIRRSILGYFEIYGMLGFKWV